MLYLCYGPSIISVTVTKGEYLRGSRLYKTSKTINRGVAELRKQFNIYKSLEYKNVSTRHT